MRPSFIAIAAALAGTGAGAQDILQTEDDWFVAGEARIQEMLAVRPNTGTARNVILFTADGMGPGTNYAIRLHAGQEAGGYGDDHVLPYEAFPNVALVRTYTTNGQTPDSAPTAAAMNTGVKMKNDVINVNDTVAAGDCAAGLEGGLTTFAEIVTGMGKSVGVVSTATLTHATPAAVYARSASRSWENDSLVPEGCEQLDIAAQLIAQMEAGVIDIALGGGRENFLPAEVTGEEGSPGARTDGRNLVEEVTGAGGRYAWDAETFAALTAPGDGAPEDAPDAAPDDAADDAPAAPAAADAAADAPGDPAPVLGLFEDSHMLYEHDRTGEPSLAEMTEMAIDALSQDPDGYFVSIEGGRVDHANHAGNLHRTVTDGVAFAEAVQTAIDMTDPEDTLIIVTADHSHALNFQGYCGRGTPITGLCMEVDPAGEAHTGVPTVADDGKPYTVAGYLNGAGSVMVEQADGTFFGARPAPTQEEATDPDYLQQALVPLGSETHSGEDVAAYALGPFAHLIAGSIEQNVIFHVMLHAVTAGEAMPTEASGEASGEAPPAEVAADPAADAADDAATADDGTSEDAVEDAAADAVDGLPAEATPEPLGEAAEGATAEPADDAAATGTADAPAEGEDTSEGNVQDDAADAVDGLPEEATAEPLGEAAEEAGEGAATP